MTDVTLCILAGGESRRMGRPKAELLIGSQSIFTFLLHRLDWPGPTLLVTAPGREHPPGCDLFDREAADPVSGEGPLRGVLTAIENSATDRLIILTVDMPLVQKSQLEFLLAQNTKSGTMMRRSVDGAEVIEPFPLVIHRDAAELVRQELAGGRRSVAALSKCAGFISIDALHDWPPEVWTNLNTSEEFNDFVKRFP